ncbi:Rho GTPase-activating protein domain protein [Cordyceps fumosorosea ARSEF 2679]|uniref:Rho GTPase-activating protein domain protein n=1 Tax=Cordyceps fumosorosea (strain ARSEF 2679) TaxID=1081104 RepID=A0A167XDX8_CORFA|nr:Rho GTPase-activating protein domain protein [Cordyceps fumosorosea ARSEF 2679]OAA64861.1 Rho GTPase-activating protein domain protein [Cordyceps fumosorosea ARSEF 2679]
MAPDSSNGLPFDLTHSDNNQPACDAGDRSWQNTGRQTPDSSHNLRLTNSNPGPTSLPGSLPAGAPWHDEPPRKSSERNRSRQRSGRSASGQVRTCKKCGEPLTGQFVRALDGTFHLDCFKCRDCGEIVASKFFPADDENGEGQYPLCETDYFRRLGLLCFQCGGALRGSYITALDRKYHVDHFTCSMCDTVFGAQDSYYEHDGNVYCHYHYSTRFAQRCNGCQTAILKQFVEIFRNGQNQHWHPECYMIHKFWNVRLGQPSDDPEPPLDLADPTARELIRVDEERMEDKVYRIWSVLSTFEESSAACISDMLLHVSNGSYVDGVLVAKRFIWHVEILFRSADRLDQLVTQKSEKGMSYGREAKLLCKKIVSFFSLLSKAQDSDARKLGVTQELLSLVTGLAHYLKLLIRICLQGALRFEREMQDSDGLHQFLDDLNDFESFKNDETASMIDGRLAAKDSDHCGVCRRSVEDECATSGDYRWHIACLRCSRCGRELGRALAEAAFTPSDRKISCTNCTPPQHPDTSLRLEHVSKLQQYVFLLKVALARLLDILRSNGTIPYPPGEKPANGLGLDRPSLGADNRSKSYSATGDREHHRESTYENTLNEVRRLRSTRLDRHLSSSVRHARTSRVMDTDGRGPRAESPAQGEGKHAPQNSTDMMFGQNDAITLDDIPRIVAVEQSKEQQQRELAQESRRPPLGDIGIAARHQRALSAGQSQDVRAPDPLQTRLVRKFFPELSALEYFNVRHLAVLTMQPMLEPEFSLDELLSFIESRKQPTFWKNLGKAFKNDKTKNVKKKGVFGVPLEVIIERDGAESTDGVGPGTLRIPAIIDDIISSMRQMDLSVEGVFRKNGNIKKQQEMVDRVNNEGCDQINFMEQPVIQLAAILKRYLRDLPDPLMTHKLYRLWISAAKIPDLAKRKQCLHLVCCLLPKSHRDCLEILFTFLKWAGTFHQLDEENGSKMDVRNLATVIAPNILTNAAKAPALDSEAIYVIDAVEILIAHIEEMCQVPDDLLTLLNDPYLFSSSTEITSKEILKRFQDRRGQIPAAEITEVYNRPDLSSRSPPKRVETDPSLWQGERTVRPVQDAPHYAQSNQGTPSAKWRNPDDPSPYQHSNYNRSEGHLTQTEHNPHEWRNSGWQQQQQHPGGLGVGNNF